jgi:hypothetical protein
VLLSKMCWELSTKRWFEFPSRFRKEMDLAHTTLRIFLGPSRLLSVPVNIFVQECRLDPIADLSYDDLGTHTQLNHRMIFERPSIGQLINRMAHMKLFSTRRIPKRPFGGCIFSHTKKDISRLQRPARFVRSVRNLSATRYLCALQNFGVQP